MGQGGLTATSSRNLFTFDNQNNASSCSLIATDMGNFGYTFKNNLKSLSRFSQVNEQHFYV